MLIIKIILKIFYWKLSHANDELVQTYTEICLIYNAINFKKNQILYHILYTQIMKTRNEYSGHKIRETKITLKTFSTFTLNNSPITECHQTCPDWEDPPGQPLCTEQSTHSPGTASQCKAPHYYPNTEEPWHLQSCNKRLWRFLVQGDAKSLMNSHCGMCAHFHSQGFGPVLGSS